MQWWKGAALPRRPSRARALRQSEKAFQQQVLTLARLKGWTAYHTFDSRRSVPGFPDLLLGRPPQLLFRELKTDTGVVTDAQQFWLALLRRCGQDAKTWRPSDWARIVKELE